MTITDVRPEVYRHHAPKRACDRCGNVRLVRDPAARRNLCRDCVSVLTTEEIARWAA